MSSHLEIKNDRIGVLLVNLGSPENTDYRAIRNYLRQFLSDPRVIEVNPLLWQIILNLFILPFRPLKTKKAYEKIWIRETNESPLAYYTRRQAEKLARRFPSLTIEWAMRYGTPSIEKKLHILRGKGCDKILICALYPQYSATTTATAHDEVFRVLQGMRWQPALRTLPPYHDHPVYIEALATSLKKLKPKPEVILVSFHGIPQEYFDRGDPYYCFCHKTARLLREKLKYDENTLRLTFQSRFGPKQWLQPYTEQTLIESAAQGVKSVAIIAPGFASDCLETMEELAIRAKEQFLKHGGKHVTVIPCLNDSKAAINLYSDLIENELQGWI